MILKDFLGVRKVSIPGFLGVGNIDKVFSGWLDLSRFFWYSEQSADLW